MRIKIRIAMVMLAVVPSVVGMSSADMTPEVPGDGKISIGRILQTQNEILIPDARRKAELVADKIEQMRQAEDASRDYSGMATPELLRLALDTMSNNSWKAAMDELSKRPDETKSSISELLQNETPFYADVAWFSRLPKVAKSFGPEYQAQIAKEILFHPLARRYDLGLLIHGDLIENLAVSPNDESPILDRLIAEGRLERGSELETKWRKLLTSGNRVGKGTTWNNRERNGENAGQTSEAGGDDRRFSAKGIMVSAVIGGCILLIGLALIAWRKMRT